MYAWLEKLKIKINFKKQEFSDSFRCCVFRVNWKGLDKRFYLLLPGGGVPGVGVDGAVQGGDGVHSSWEDCSSAVKM